VLWIAVESLTTWLPGFRPEIIPAQLNQNIRIVLKGQTTGLEIGNVVGSVALLNGDTLQIKPKVGEMNFFRMLLACEGLYSKLKTDIEEFAGYEENQEISLIRLVARRFLRELHMLIKASPRFEWKKDTRQLSFAEGRVILVPTIINLRKKASSPIVAEIRYRDFDTPENRLLAAAAHQALQYVGEVTPDTAAAKYWIARFESNRSLSRDIATVNQCLRTGKYAGTRGYYIGALALATLILGQAGFAQGDIEEIYGDSVLVNSATLFEEYVRTILAQSYSCSHFC